MMHEPAASLGHLAEMLDNLINTGSGTPSKPFMLSGDPAGLAITMAILAHHAKSGRNITYSMDDGKTLETLRTNNAAAPPVAITRFLQRRGDIDATMVVQLLAQLKGAPYTALTAELEAAYQQTFDKQRKAVSERENAATRAGISTSIRNQLQVLGSFPAKPVAPPAAPTTDPKAADNKGSSGDIPAKYA